MKKIYCVIFSVMLVVFTMIPVTAFAYTGAANADYRSIAKNNDILIADNMKYYVVYTQRGATDYVYCAFSIILLRLFTTMDTAIVLQIWVAMLMLLWFVIPTKIYIRTQRHSVKIKLLILAHILLTI